VVQQSPNGLYKLSVTDTGIELRGPKGWVTINDAGVTIRAQGTVTVEGGEMGVRVDRDATYRVGSNLTIEAASNVHLMGHGSTDVSADGRASFTGSSINLGLCSNAKPAARLGDQVNTTASPTPFVAQGSQTVLIC
jgi:hypothetical protein